MTEGIMKPWFESRTNYWGIVLGGAVYFITAAAFNLIPASEAAHEFYWMCGGVLFCWIRNRWGW